MPVDFTGSVKKGYFKVTYECAEKRLIITSNGFKYVRRRLRNRDIDERVRLAECLSGTSNILEAIEEFLGINKKEINKKMIELFKSKAGIRIQEEPPLTQWVWSIWQI